MAYMPKSARPVETKTTTWMPKSARPVEQTTQPGLGAKVTSLLKSIKTPLKPVVEAGVKAGTATQTFAVGPEGAKKSLSQRIIDLAESPVGKALTQPKTPLESGFSAGMPTGIVAAAKYAATEKPIKQLSEKVTEPAAKFVESKLQNVPKVEMPKEIAGVPVDIPGMLKAAVPGVSAAEKVLEWTPEATKKGVPFGMRLAGGIASTYAPSEYGKWLAAGYGMKAAAQGIKSGAVAGFAKLSPEHQQSVLKLTKWLEKQFKVGGGLPEPYLAGKAKVIERKLEGEIDKIRIAKKLGDLKPSKGDLAYLQNLVTPPIGEKAVVKVSEKALLKSDRLRALDNVAKDIRQTMDKWSQLAIDSGMLPKNMEDTFKKNIGTYLFRQYDMFVDPGASPQQMYNALKAMRINSKIFKRRADVATLVSRLITKEKLTPGMEKLLAQPYQETLIRELLLKQRVDPFGLMASKVSQLADGVGKAELFTALSKNPEYVVKSQQMVLTPEAQKELAPLYKHQMDLRLQAKGARLNIGMAVKGQANLTDDEIQAALKEFGITPTQFKIHPSATEPTFVVDISKPLSKEQLYKLSERLRQSAIPQFELGSGKGMMAGPKAAEWGEFNPDYFLGMDGKAMGKAGVSSLDDQILAIENQIAAFKGKVSKMTDVPVPEGFVAMPMDKKAWGDIAGQYVQKDIYDDLMIAQKYLMKSGTLYDKTLTMFKYGKVALNPSAQARNFLTNIILLDMSGVPLSKMPKALYDAAQSLSLADDSFMMATKLNVFGTGFASRELQMKSFAEKMIQTSFNQSDDMLGSMGSIVTDLSKIPGNVYQFNENIFKFARFKWGLAHGELPELAAKAAQKALFNYNEVPRAIEFIRRSPFGAPFITFTYKSLPRVAETMMTDPMKLYKYKAFVDGWNDAAKRTLNISQEDAENVPSYLKTNIPGVPSYMLLPFKDEAGRKIYLDIQYITPLGMAPEVAERGLLKGMVTSPFVNLVADISRNQDTFGREIVPEGLDEIDSYKANRLRVTHIVNQLLPALTPRIPGVTEKGSSSAEKIVDGIMQRKYYGQKKVSVNRMILDVFAGLKTTPISEEQVVRNKVRGIQAVVNTFKKEMRDINVAEQDGRMTKREADSHREFYQKQINLYLRAQMRLTR